MEGFFLSGKLSSNRPRVPLAVSGVQVNFCKNMDCSNFGTYPSSLPQKRGPGNASKDDYVIATKKPFRKALKCKRCNQYSMLKSNQGVFEEAARFAEYLDKEPTIVGCPVESCGNSTIDVRAGTAHYYRGGVTNSGSQRYRCKACSKSFSISNRPIDRQRVSHKNKTIMKLLMNKGPFARICEVMEISMSTLYRKLDFLHRQCLAFVSERERKLLTGQISLERLYLATDRQDYFVNWTNTLDKRHVVLKGIGTADLRSGYVFGMHLNYDPRLDPRMIQEMAAQNGDDSLDMAFREFARIWLVIDHERVGRRPAKPDPDPIPQGTLALDIARRYYEALEREEIEASDEPEVCNRLPVQGMQIHEEYTMYGHFLFLKWLLGKVGKLRFYLDQDSGIRAACLSAFSKEILDARCDAFYVRVNKDLNIHQKNKLINMFNHEMEEQRQRYPDLSDKSIKLLWIAEEMKRMKQIGTWQDRWLEYPFPNGSEPEKSVCYLTDRNDLQEMQLARLYYMASLHKIDSFFNQIHSRLNSLDRPEKSMSNQGRSYLKYQLYKPETAQKLLDMFRVYHNYHLVSDDDKLTSAMRLGLAKAPIPIDDIVNFRKS
jgi:transposase-like protein